MSVSAIDVCHNHHLSPVILQKTKTNNVDHGFKITESQIERKHLTVTAGLS